MSANDRQVGGDHYRKKGTEIQHWDYAEMKEYDKWQYVITKYVERWRDKNGIADLEKAMHYLEKYIEVEKAKHEKMMQKTCAEVMASPYKSDTLVGPKSPGVLEQFRNRVMPPKVQRLEDVLPDLSGQKHPFGFNPEDEKAAEDIFCYPPKK